MERIREMLAGKDDARASTVGIRPAPDGPAGHDSPVHVRIRPTKGWVSLQLGRIWEYRELLFFLTWRDVKIRYKQTVLGAAWAVLQPFLTMLIFSLFFGKLSRIPSDNLPYPLFAFAGLVPWTFFSSGLTKSSNSLVGNSNLVKKVYFPRLTIPVSCVGSGLVDLLLAATVLLAILAYYWATGQYQPVFGMNLLFLPALLVLAVVTTLGVGLWLSALNVQYRDIQHTVPFLTQFWLFATPIAYPSSLIKSEVLRSVYAINPMAGVVEGVRWALLGTDTAPGPMIAVSSLVAVTLLVSGAFYFRRMERTFADVV